MDIIPEELILLIIKSAPEISLTLSLLNHEFNRICMDKIFWFNLLRENFNIDSDYEDNYIGRYWRLNRFVKCNNLSSHNLNNLMLRVQTPDQIDILLRKGANIEAKTDSDCTALHHAAHNGNDKVISKLIAKGANIETKDYNGMTPLHSAVRKGNDKVVSELIAKGADIEAKDNEGWTALHHAAHRGHDKIVSELIAKGANIEAKTNAGLTALHYAADNNNYKVVRELIVKGANIEVKTDYGWTPLHYAVCNGHDKVRELISKGGKG